MSERPEYAPGTFCWADVTTTDQEGAKAFYCELFSWEPEDNPVGDGVYYTIMRHGGKDVAAISPQPQQQREAGVPPTWNSYVSVESADAVAERAEELGGTLHAPPFDVMDAGRMAVLQDPQGAFLCMWEPRRHVGAALIRAAGALCWNELVTSDLDAACTFYADLFDWTITIDEAASKPYRFIMKGEYSNGGMRAPDSAAMAAHWAVYFGANGVEPTLARAEELGAVTIAGPVDVGVGTAGTLRDPQGAAFGIFTPHDRPTTP